MAVETHALWGWSCELTMPLPTGLGRKNPILPEDMESLQLLAGHMGLALENAMLYEEEEKFNKILEKTVRERTSELARATQADIARLFFFSF